MFCIRKETKAVYAAVENPVRIVFESTEHTDGTEHELVARLGKSNEFAGNKRLIMAPSVALSRISEAAPLRDSFVRHRRWTPPFVFVLGNRPTTRASGLNLLPDESIAPPCELLAKYFMAIKFAESSSRRNA